MKSRRGKSLKYCKAYFIQILNPKRATSVDLSFSTAGKAWHKFKSAAIGWEDFSWIRSEKHILEIFIKTWRSSHYALHIFMKHFSLSLQAVLTLMLSPSRSRESVCPQMSVERETLLLMERRIFKRIKWRIYGSENERTVDKSAMA